MGGQWHYAKGDRRFGPVSESEIKELFESGDLDPSDLVWQSGMAEWVPAADVEEIAPQGAPPPLPGPPALPGRSQSGRSRVATRARRSRAAVQDGQQTPGVAIGALVLGIASLIAWILPLIGFPVSISGIVCGAKGINTSGKGMAIAGLVTGIIGLGLTILNSAAGAMMEMNQGGYQPPPW